MKKKFSPLIQKYFEHWIELETWDSTHWADKERFYQFVKACFKYRKKKISSSDIKTAIKEAVLSKRPTFNEEELDHLAEQFSQEFATIRDYEETPFPDDWVEMRNPIRVKHYLRMLRDERNAQLYSESQIQEILKRNFGENWEENVRRRISGQSIPPKQPKDPSQGPPKK
jgi:hypothetical protein